MLLERLGNLHLVLLHLPIGFVFAAVLLEIWQWRRPSSEGRLLTKRLLAVNAVATLVTAAAGLLLAEGGSYAPETLLWHRWLGVGCAGLAIVAWWTYRGRGQWVARAMLGVLLVAIVATGHLGGTLTHGADVADFWRLPVVMEPEVKVTSATATTSVFESQIRPLLSDNCFKCHGPERSRGDLRLDSRPAALAGGESGVPSIVAGDPAHSELLRRVKLPADDEDAMPTGKNARPLTAEQIAVLEQWIADGAVWE